ncbi:MAG: hypothetical protein AAGC81_02265 [Pseudomonadota bacterium]
MTDDERLRATFIDTPPSRTPFLKGWRTRLFNLSSIVIAILSLPEVVALIPAEYGFLMALAIAAGNAILREVTTTPAGLNQ